MTVAVEDEGEGQDGGTAPLDVVRSQLRHKAGLSQGVGPELGLKFAGGGVEEVDNARLETCRIRHRVIGKSKRCKTLQDKAEKSYLRRRPARSPARALQQAAWRQPSCH